MLVEPLQVPELTRRERSLILRLRWGVFWSSWQRGGPGMQEESFERLADANSAARVLFARAAAHYGGRTRLNRSNPFAATMRTGGDPLRVWVERIGIGDEFEDGPVLRYDPALRQVRASASAEREGRS